MAMRLPDDLAGVDMAKGMEGRDLAMTVVHDQVEVNVIGVSEPTGRQRACYPHASDEWRAGDERAHETLRHPDVGGGRRLVSGRTSPYLVQSRNPVASYDQVVDECEVARGCDSPAHIVLPHRAAYAQRAQHVRRKRVASPAQQRHRSPDPIWRGEVLRWGEVEQ